MKSSMGNSMCRSAYLETEVGKKYSLPMTWMWTGKEEDITRLSVPKRKKMLCVGKYPYHAVFESERGVRISMTYYDLAVIYSKNRSLV